MCTITEQPKAKQASNARQWCGDAQRWSKKTSCEPANFTAPLLLPIANPQPGSLAMQIRLLFAAAAALSLTAGVATAQRTSTDLNASPTTMNTGQGSQMRVVTGPGRSHGQGQSQAFCASNEVLVTAQCLGAPQGQGGQGQTVYGGMQSNGLNPPGAWAIRNSGSRQGASCPTITNGFNNLSHSPPIRIICATR